MKLMWELIGGESQQHHVRYRTQRWGSIVRYDEESLTAYHLVWPNAFTESYNSRGQPVVEREVKNVVRFEVSVSHGGEILTSLKTVVSVDLKCRGDTGSRLKIQTWRTLTWQPEKYMILHMNHDLIFSTVHSEIHLEVTKILLTPAQN